MKTQAVSGFSSLDDFLRNFLDASLLVMDPTNLFCKASEWRWNDVICHTGGDPSVASGRTAAKVLVWPSGSDKVFTVADCGAEQELIRGSELKVLERRWGMSDCSAWIPITGIRWMSR